MARDPNWRSRAVSADEAVKLIPSGGKVFIHGAAATPTPLLDAMCRGCAFGRRQADHRAPLHRGEGHDVADRSVTEGRCRRRDHARPCARVVTEYGAVNLHGLTIRKRGEALTSIAHPDFRGELTKQFAAIRHFVM